MVETTTTNDGGSSGGTTTETQSMTDKLLEFFKTKLGMGVAAGAIAVIALYWFVF